MLLLPRTCRPEWRVRLLAPHPGSCPAPARGPLNRRGCQLPEREDQSVSQMTVAVRQVVADREERRLGSIMQARLSQNCRDVILDGALGESQSLSDFAIGCPTPQ